MGLFTKKVCAFCNKQLGLLDSALSIKLADGNILGACCTHLTSYYSYYLKLSSKTKEQVQEHINEVQIMRNKIASEFEVTDVITYYNDPSKVLASIDRNRRLWISSQHKDELFSLDDISKLEVDLDYYKDEQKVIPRAPYTPPRADMPEPFSDRNMSGMTILVYIENHPYKITEPLKLEICKYGPKLLQSYNSYFDEVYTHGAKCLELFESLMK